MPSYDTLGERFERDPNALVIVRVALSLMVVLYHAHLVLGAGDLTFYGGQFLSSFRVDAFFGLSGFLIFAAWERRPQPRRFIRHRAARIMPGYWAALLLTAFVIAPMATSTGVADRPSLPGQLAYIGQNSLVLHLSPIVGEVSNAALWSLFFEVLFYGLLVTIATKKRITPRGLLTAFVLFWALSLGWAMAGGSTVHSLFVIFHRPGLMIVCGMLLWMYRARVPMNGRGALVATGMLAIGMATPDYRLLGAASVVYLCLYTGFVLARAPRLRIKTDVSYGIYLYHFPVQSALVAAGLQFDVWWHFAAVSLIVVLPLAALSWFVVEQPAMRWARRRDALRVGTDSGEAHAHSVIMQPRLDGPNPFTAALATEGRTSADGGSAEVSGR